MGKIGCKLSHVKALQYAERRAWSHVAIFEDDFQWIEGIETKKVLQNIRSIQEWVPEWDVIVISLNVYEKTVFPEKRLNVGINLASSLMQVRRAVATHGYLVRAHMIPILKEVFKRCEVRNSSVAIDTCWLPLQETTKWYGLTPQLGTQAVSYSDIESAVVKYDIKS